jgi:hypothetical protein
MNNLEQLATRLDNLQTSLSLIKYDLENALKQLEEQPTPKVETAWYDFTEEQMTHLGEIVNNFIDKLTRDMSSTTVYLQDGSIQVSVEVDVQELVEDALPYGMINKFIEYLNDEITEQREEQREDSEESQDN